MATSVFDSVLFRDQFGTSDMREIFSDCNLVQKWLDVESALASAEARLGIIPPEAAEEIRRVAKCELIDMDTLGEQMSAISHPIVPLVRQLTDLCSDESGQYVHWGATTQDIMDTAMVLQMRDASNSLIRGLYRIQSSLLDIVKKHRDSVMVGRTHGQHGLPITFGYKVAVWLDEFNRDLDRFDRALDETLVGQFSGAVGTLASLSERGLEVRSVMMEELDLRNPNIAWHSSRDRLAEFASSLGIIVCTLGKISDEIYHLQQTEIGELEEPSQSGKVGSSTMPHKRNPSTVENISSICKLFTAKIPLFFDGMLHEYERDMRRWQTEWETVPSICLLASAAIDLLSGVLEGLVVNKSRMAENLGLTRGLVMSESVMMHLGARIGRQNAHEMVYEAAQTAFRTSRDLIDVLQDYESIKAEFDRNELDGMFEVDRYTGYSGEFCDTVVDETARRVEARG